MNPNDRPLTVADILAGGGHGRDRNPDDRTVAQDWRRFADQRIARHATDAADTITELVDWLRAVGRTGDIDRLTATVNLLDEIADSHGGPR